MLIVTSLKQRVMFWTGTINGTRSEEPETVAMSYEQNKHKRNRVNYLVS